MSKEIRGKILPDRPLDNGSSDRFGYGEIAANLASLIRQAPTPLTIGLYGQWGVGKSTICRAVERELNDKGDFKVFYFDTWKYERDSFRRQFLIELDKEIFHDTLDYKRKLNQSLTLPYLPPLKEALKKSFDLSVRIIFVKLVVPLILLVVSLVALLGVNWLVHPFLDVGFEDILKTILEAFTSVGLALYLGAFIFEAVRVFKGEVETPKTDSAEGFEYYFRDALEKLSIRGERLLIIIDNLDRLDYSKAVEHLSDIKTFLASEKVDDFENKTIFLIPCDNEALSTQLRLNNKDLDTEEYLRKFFNVSFRIPRLLIPELDDYIAEQLKETGISTFTDNYSLSFVISRAFQNNPRQIIQFINSLTSTYLLAEKRNIQLVVAQDKVACLARILVIRVRWPEIYSKLETIILRSAKSLAEAIEELKPVPQEWGDSFDEFESFIAATDVIPIPDGEEILFFSLKEFEGVKEIPEWSAFISAAENRNGGMEEVFEKIEKNGKLLSLNAFLVTYVRRNRGKEAKIANVFLSLSKVITESTLKTFSPFIHDALNALSPNFISTTEEFSFDFIFQPTFKDIESRIRNNILKRICDVASTTSATEKIAEIALERGLAIWTLIRDNEAEFAPQKAKLVGAKNTFISNIKIPPLFQSTPTDYVPLVKHLSKFVYKDFPIDRQLFHPIARFSFQILQQPTLHQPNIAQSESIKILLEDLAGFLELTKPVIRKTDPDFDAVRQLTSQLLAIANSGDPNIVSLTLRSAIRLASSDNPQCAEILERAGTFIERRTSQPEEAENLITGTFGAEELVALAKAHERIKQALIQRTAFRPNLFISLKLDEDFFTQDKWQQTLTQLVGQNAVGFNELLSYLKYKIPDGAKPEVAIHIIRNLNQSDPSIVKGLLTALGKIGILAPQLSELLQNLRAITVRGGEHDKLVKDFVKKHINAIGEAQAEEFLK